MHIPGIDPSRGYTIPMRRLPGEVFSCDPPELAARIRAEAAQAAQSADPSRGYTIPQRRLPGETFPSEPTAPPAPPIPPDPSRGYTVPQRRLPGEVLQGDPPPPRVAIVQEPDQNYIIKPREYDPTDLSSAQANVAQQQHSAIASHSSLTRLDWLDGEEEA